MLLDQNKEEFLKYFLYQMKNISPRERIFILHLGNPFGFFYCNSIFLIHRCSDEIKTLFYEEYIKSKKVLLLFPFLSISQRESFTCSLPSASFAFRKTLSMCNGKSREIHVWHTWCCSLMFHSYLFRHRSWNPWLCHMHNKERSFPSFKIILLNG